MSQIGSAGRGAGVGLGERRTIRKAGNIYVSHIDIFRFDCYPKTPLRERIVPVGQPLTVIVEPIREARSDGSAATYRDLGRDAKSGKGPRLNGAKLRARPRRKCHGSAIRPNGRPDLVRRQARARARGQHPRADPRPALRQRRVRGRTGLWRHDLQMHRAFRAAEEFRPNPRLRDPLFGRRDRRRQAAGAGKERHAGRYVRAIAWRGSEQLGVSAASRTRFISRSPPGSGRAISIRRSGSRASASISPTTAGPIRRPRPASPRPPAST